MKALRCESVRALEKHIAASGIDSLILMERAGEVLYRHVMEAVKTQGKRICIVCGPGNNGGDGFVLARLLAQNKKADLCVACDANIALMSREAQINANALAKEGILLHAFAEISFQAYDIIVDCLFGIGINRVIQAPYADVIKRINASDAYVIACDVPSGLDADRGCMMGCAVSADETISLLCGKQGLYRQDGLDCAGKVIIEPLGIEPDQLAAFDGFNILDREQVGSLLPKRHRNSHKGSYGKVLVIGGRMGMSGAALLCTEAALRSGAGLVTLMSEPKTLFAAAVRIPEAMTHPLPEKIDAEVFQALLGTYDCVAIGNGLGRDDYARRLVDQVWQSECCAVFDGDALALLDDEKARSPRQSPYILTPHPKEVSYLIDMNIHDVIKNPSEALYESERAYCGAVLVLKNACTMISDGKRRWLNTLGNDALAKGGSGDVLCGMILGFLAQSKNPLAAALCGVYVHACCAEMLVEHRAGHGILASDLIRQLPETLYALLQKQ